MSPARTKPLIGISACLKPREFGFMHAVVDKYVDAIVEGADGLPMLIPALGDRLDIDSVLDRLDGVFLTGSPSNVDPDYYGGAAPREGNLADPIRDSTVLPLIRRAVERGIPLFGVCRGIQELNVAYGGSLHQHIWEVPGRDDHRSDKTKSPEQRYDLRHEVTIEPGGVLAGIFPGRSRLRVNSLHAQAVDNVAPGLRVECRASDGTIEGLSVEGARSFALGVQWHPEFRVRDNPDRLALFETFGSACRAAMTADFSALDLRQPALA